MAIYNRAVTIETNIHKINLMCSVDTDGGGLYIDSCDPTSHFHPLTLDEKCISLCQEISNPSFKDLKDS